MKKTILFMIGFLLISFIGNAQCTNSNAFGSASINPSGALVTISTCPFAGEYSTLSNAVAGTTLRITSSIATDFITVHSNSPSGPVLAFGVTPLVFSNTFTGTIYAHWNTNSSCGTQNNCRTTTVQDITACVTPISLTCPNNIVVDNTTGQCGANVSFAATATGNPTPSLAYSKTSGSFFPIGTTTVTVTASSICGTQTCSFTVTVNPNNPLPAIVPTFNPVPFVCTGGAISPLPTTSTNGITGSWSPALDNTTTTTYTFTPNPGQCAVSTTLTINVGPPVGDPSVFGSNQWNVYAWNSGDLSGTPWSTNYSGYYTVSGINFNTGNQWGNGGAPSDTSGYLGCPVSVDNHSWSAKRQGFPTNYYSIDINSHDDEGQLWINGVMVWNHTGCCDSHTAVWTGVLSTTDQVEFRATEGVGGSHGVMNMNVILPTVSANGPTTFCQGGNVVLTSSATNGTGYLWSNGETTQSITVSTSGSYSVQFVYPAGNGTASAATAVVASSPTVSISGPTSICSGGSVTLTASGASSYMWSGNLTTVPLDNISSTKLAIGLRKLKSSYAGSCLRLRRSSDNAESDFGFNGNDLDTAAITTWLSGATGYCVALYDQSGNGGHVSQANAANQPTLVLSGINGKPVLHFNTQQLLFNNVNYPSAFTAIYGARQTGGNRARVLSSPSNNWLLGYWNGAKRQAYFEGWISSNPGQPFADNNYYIYSGASNGSSSQLYEDGVLIENNSGGVTGPNGIELNGWFGGSEMSDCDFTDVFVFNTVLSTTDRKFVENSTRNYYSPNTASIAVAPTATTTYTVVGTDALGCSASASVTVTVDNAVSFVPAFNQVGPICPGTSFSLPTTSTNGITGTWSPAPNNTADTTYTFTPDAGQCATTASMTVTIDNTTVIVPAFTQIADVCSGSSFSLPTTSTNGVTGSWSPAPNSSAATTYTFTPNPGQCATTATMTVGIVTGLPGDPSVFGSNVWNVYAWNSGDISGVRWSTNYAGYYTATGVNFNTQLSWDSNTSPSGAPGYTGCPVGNDNHSWSAKRQGFPANYYTINIDGHDDQSELWINGVMVWQHLGCCDTHTNVWQGFLGATDQIDFRTSEGGGGSNGAISFSTTPPVLTGTPNVCIGSSNGSITAPIIDGASYLWSPGGATTTTVSGLASGTYCVTISKGAASVQSCFTIGNYPAPTPVSIIQTGVTSACNPATVQLCSSLPISNAAMYALAAFPGGSTAFAKYDVDLVNHTMVRDFAYSGLALGGNTFGMDRNPVTGEVFFITGSGSSARTLYTLDLTTNATVNKGLVLSTTGNNNVQDFTFDAAGNMYAAFQGGVVQKINYNSPALTPTAFASGLPYNGGVGLTYDNDANRLLYTTGSSSFPLYEISTSGVVNFMFNYNSANGAGTAQGLEYVGNNTCYISSTFSNNIIYRLNLITHATTTVISPTNFSAAIKDLMLLPSTTVQWSDSSGNLGATACISVSPSVTTTYTLTATNANGCTTSTTHTVNVEQIGTNGSVTITSATPYTWPLPYGTGLTYTTSQTGLTNVVGCNTATLNLTITSNTFTIGSSCGSTISNLAVTIVTPAVSGATSYMFRLRNMVTNAVQVITRPVNSFALSNYPGITLGTPYQIEVSTNNGATYGPPCIVNTPSPTATIGAQCGTTLTSMTEWVYATYYSTITGYRFRVRNTATNAVQIFDSSLNRFSFSQLPNRSFGTTYFVEVALKNTNGAYLPYSAGCTITTPAFPTTSIVASQCNSTPTSNTQSIAAVVVSGATDYRFLLSKSAPLAYNATKDRNVNNFALNMFSGLTAGTTYNVQVAVKIDGVWGPYGSVCHITTPGGTTKTISNETALFKAIAYPNPFAADFKLDVTTTANSSIQVRVYDMLGKQVENRSVAVTELENLQIGSGYPSGVYNVIVSQDENTQTLRVIKR